MPQGRSLAIGTGIASSLTLVALLLLCRRCRGSRPRTERKKRSSAAKRQAGLAVFGLNPSSCGEEDAEGIRAAIDRGWLDGGHVVLIADVKMKEDQERIREIARNSGLAEEIPAHVSFVLLCIVSLSRFSRVLDFRGCCSAKIPMEKCRFSGC